MTRIRSISLAVVVTMALVLTALSALAPKPVTPHRGAGEARQRHHDLTTL